MEKIIKLALEEDLSSRGDVTSQAIFDDESADFSLIAKDEGILCGSEYFKNVFAQIDEEISIKFLFKDGDKIHTSDIIAKLSGCVMSILKGERVALNFLSHLSGIASKTAKYVYIAGGNTKILDTRKTIPCLRKAEKYAVKCGGGVNHRMGLYDMVLIKDNHIDAAGSITKAVEKVRDKFGDEFKIEVETRNLPEVQAACDCKVDRIMLDNMNNATMIKAIAICDGKVEVEASGNMNMERVKEVSNLALDYISIGELTHTLHSFDFSLQYKDANKLK